MNSSDTSPAQERVLLLLPPQAHGVSVPAILNEAMLPSHACADLDEMRRELPKGAGAAVLPIELLTPPAMRKLLEALSQQEIWSDLPLVILCEHREQSPGIGVRMLDLLEPLGNFTVLRQPVDALELVSTLQAALRTRRRQYQQRALLNRWDRAVRHRDRFLSLVAHELRNPLTTIRNAVEILEYLGPPTGKLAEQHALIARQTTRLAVSIDEMLDVYQVLAGKVRLRREPTDLAGLVARGLAFVEREAAAQRRRLAFPGAGESFRVHGDRQRLQQAINYLLMDALHSTPAGGRIEVALARAAGEAVLRVTLAETNLSAEVFDHLLDQFSDADDALERPPGGGLGIGLTLVQGLVRLHGGSITASRPGGGPGAEFCVRFPLAPASAATPAAPAAPVPGRRRLLVIEDNRDSRESLRMLLQLWGHTVETAADGLEGVRKAVELRPEIVLSDIGLPGQDGYEVARQARAALGRGIYLIAMTGFGQPHDRQQAVEAGFDRYLVKPVVPAELQELLAGFPGTAEEPAVLAATAWAPGAE